MKDKGHFFISVTKSLIRIIFGTVAFSYILNIQVPIAYALRILIWGLIVAEVFGIIEEGWS